MFEDWDIIGDSFSDNDKGRSYMYKRVFGECKEHQSPQENYGSDNDGFGQSVEIHIKNMVVAAPWKDNGTGPHEGPVYEFTPQVETWTEDKN